MRDKDSFLNNLLLKRKTVRAEKDDSDDYTVKKDKTIEIITKILSVLGAIIIWIYVVNNDVATYEYKSIRISLRDENAIIRAGYEVEYDTTFMSIKVQGGAKKIEKLSADSVKAYVDLSGVDLSSIVGSKFLSVPIKLELPRDITCVEQSRDSVYVTISVRSDNAE